jgi:hypothetical protein
LVVPSIMSIQVFPSSDIDQVNAISVGDFIVNV